MFAVKLVESQQLTETTDMQKSDTPHYDQIVIHKILVNTMTKVNTNTKYCSQRKL